jgi:hydroxypyruvate isomerase
VCGHVAEGKGRITYLPLADHPRRYEPGTGEILYNRVVEETYGRGPTSLGAGILE